MKGVVLAGSRGMRLRPITSVINKHMLPVYDRPMLAFPLTALRSAGIDEVLVVTGERDLDDVRTVLAELPPFGFTRVEMTAESDAGGIAAALALAEPFCDGEPLLAVLGDNVFNASLAPFASNFVESGRSARVMLKRVRDAERFGVAELRDGTIVSIEEKPTRPSSALAVLGIYAYAPNVFEVIRELERSARGEFEITDVNTFYARAGDLGHDEFSSWWVDAGEFDTLLEASMRVASERESPQPE